MVRVGLVLSGGGARGFAEIGALKVLKKNDIKIDAITGCSIGAVIGSCYAHDQDPEAIERLLLKMKGRWDIYDYAFSMKGIIKGEKFEKYLLDYFTKDKSRTFMFEDLKIPLAVNATDIVNQKEVILEKGPLMPAVMASMSYPGFFTTRKVDKKICIDGGAVNPMPCDLLRNVDYIIMIDVSRQNIRINDNSNIKDIVLQATLVMQRTIVEKSIESCSIPHTVITPDVEYHGVLEFENLGNLVKEGESAAEKMIDKIKSDIAELDKGSSKVLKI